MMDWVYQKLWTFKEHLLNSLAVAFVIGVFYTNIYVSIILSVWLLLSPYWPLFLVYLVWMYLDRETPYKPGRSWELLKSAKLYQRFRNYFPMFLIKTADIPPTKNYIFCHFPHGLVGAGAIGNFSGRNPEFEKMFPGIKLCGHTLNVNFYMPFTREYTILWGFRSVSKESLVNCLSQGAGHASVIVVGGTAEAMVAKAGTNKIVLKDRKGFVKLAITTGADLVPIYAFGENEIYHHYLFPRDGLIYKLQEAARSFTSIAFVAVSGRGIFQTFYGILPFKKPIYTVVGKPIPVEKKENPTNEEITALHTLFIKELVDLFNKHKYNYLPNPDSVFLEVL